ncbi:MAG: YbaK/EbsC family protein [Candidatus Woesearchaeota archaeon]
MLASVEELQQKGIKFELRQLVKPAYTAKDVEDLGIPLSQVLKSLLFIGDEPIMVVLQGTKKVDLQKLKKLMHFRDIRLATKEETLQLTSYPIGSVSAFGLKKEIKKVLDKKALDEYEFHICAGEPDKNIVLSNQQLLKAAKWIIEDISQS